MAKLSKSEKTTKAQALVVKRYKLGTHDRSILIFGGIANSTGKFGRKREEQAVNKLMGLGLLRKEEAKYDTFNYNLTLLGRLVAKMIISNQDS